MTTVTIQVDDELFDRARQLAAARKMTVSEMLERLLRVVAEPPPIHDLPPNARKALGMLPPMTDDEVEQILHDERMRKHGG
jgi:hypothetical protein